MKAIIPVAGIGSKLRPLTHTQPKALVPVAGKPILSHIVDILVGGGIREFCFIIGYLGDKIESFIEENYRKSGLSVEFVIQEPREGIAHALWCARESIRNEKEVLIMLGDTILTLDIQGFLKVPTSVLGTKKVETPGNFGVVEIDSRDNVKRLIEKPKIPKSNLALVGIYKLNNPKLFVESIEKIIDDGIKTLGEYQLTDALMEMLKHGEPMGIFPVNNWYDCGKKESLLEANAILLNSDEFMDTDKYNYPNSVIIPPVSISESCKIENSIIGPNVAIGEDTTVRNSIIENSIIGSFSRLDVAVLNGSVIGSDTILKGPSQSLNIGDNTEINYSSKE
ncbi:MAG: glucose-1-phosphate thymidylyltransferase [Cyclobacteriaceae bacterium]|nr:MAG: glucose-1-phosphate thymidylyltransferase [Cyclobacteriaceae bacterium]